MRIVYSDQPIPTEIGLISMFLAGPTPRGDGTPSWRPEALQILSDLKYNGTVFVPEHKTWNGKEDYLDQVEWEDEALDKALFQVFWIPRDLKTMPAFTTNVEFGRFVHFQSCLYGRPDNAPKNRYLDWLYKKYNGQTIHNDLTELLKSAL